MTARFSRRWLIPACLLFAFTPTVSAQDSGAKAYLKGVRSSVYIRAPEWSGSGFVVDVKKGLVVTNWHVVDGLKEVQITFPIWERGRPIAEKSRYEGKVGLRAKVLASEERVDLGVVQILEPSKIPIGTEQVRFCADSPLPGTKIVSIGNPGASDARWVYTPGEVRSVYIKKWQSSGGEGTKINSHESRIVEATSPTSPGDSGGPCFNDSVELIGVTQGGKRAIIAQGYSYFIEVSEVKKFLKANRIHITEADSGTEVVTNPPATEPDPKDAPRKDPPTKEPPVKKEPPKKNPPKQDTDTDKLEKAAEGELKLIKVLAKDPNRRDFTVDRLKTFIKKYAGTDAAKEAQKLLGQLE